jgi:PKD repeat protein
MVVVAALAADAASPWANPAAHAQIGQLQVSAGGPYVGQVGQPILFSAQVAFNGVLTTAVQYQWNFGDGGTGLGQTTSHAYVTPGTFTVTVTVVTANGQTGFGSTIAQIGGAAQGQLTVSAGGPYTGQVGQAILFSAQVLGTVFPFTSTVQFQWSFGDGGTGVGQTTSHVYTAAGTYTVTVTATTGTAVVGSATTTAQIGGVAQGQLQVNPGGPYTGTTGQPVTFSGNASGVPLGVTVQYQWSFGDGSTGAGQTTTHTFTSPGTFTVTLTVTTSTGLSGSASTTVTVSGSTTTSTSTEQVQLFAACNNVAATWPSGTPIATVAAAISPGNALTAIWRFDNVGQRFVGFSPIPGAPNDLTTVNRADAVFICMTSPGTLTRPVI